jgi:EpsI family protein
MTGVNLYVGYYSSVGVGGGYHSPKNCLPGGGWGIDTVKTIQLQAGIEGKKQSIVTEMLIRKGDEYQIVLYWYQNRGRVITSEYWEKIYLVLDALFKGRRDGTFVRIMVPAKGAEIEDAERRAQKFAQQVMVALENHLPGSRL